MVGILGQMAGIVMKQNTKKNAVIYMHCWSCVHNTIMIIIFEYFHYLEYYHTKVANHKKWG